MSAGLEIAGVVFNSSKSSFCKGSSDFAEVRFAVSEESRILVVVSIQDERLGYVALLFTVYWLPSIAARAKNKLVFGAVDQITKLRRSLNLEMAKAEKAGQPSVIQNAKIKLLDQLSLVNCERGRSSVIQSRPVSCHRTGQARPLSFWTTQLLRKTVRSLIRTTGYRSTCDDPEYQL
jgi:hypothetical protein